MRENGAMPVSAYLRASILLIAAAAALFGSAGSLAIPTFWVYWAILVAVFIAAFALLDRGLLQERMRPGGRPNRRINRSSLACLFPSAPGEAHLSFDPPGCPEAWRLK
jgi:hypothetical protein